MDIEAKIWKINNGELTEVMIDETVFIKKEPKTMIEAPMEIIAISSSPPKKKYKHGIKLSYLEKWITKEDIKVFTLDQFFKVYPMQKKSRTLDKVISKLIAEKKIIQLGKTKFKVVT